MEATPYSNRELDRIVGDLRNEIVGRLDYQDGFLKEIKIQTTKTNGRVSAGERWIFAGKIVISIFAFVVIPLCVYIYNNQINWVSEQISQLRK